MFELGRRLTARIGGAALEVLEPQCRQELVDQICRLREQGRRFHLLGGGSNVIAGDEVLDDPVIWTRRLQAVTRLSDTRYLVEAGANLTALGRRTAQEGLHGLECCVGIPGTVGAAIRINAGGKFGTVASVVREVTVLTPRCTLERLAVAATDFSYRSSRFQDDVVLAAELQFERADPEDCRARVREVLKHKRDTQPLRYPSAGCIFRNPPGDSAGRLIDRAGLKGARRGGALVSPLHANYIVNVGLASGRDFLDLIAHVRETVERRFGVVLELEVEVWSAS